MSRAQYPLMTMAPAKGLGSPESRSRGSREGLVIRKATPVRAGGGGMDDAELVRAALTRSPSACRQLVSRLTPVVHRRVAQVWTALAPWRGPAVERNQLLDLTQQMLLLLFDNDGRVLARWDANLGLSLENFVGLVAEREVATILRSGRRSAWAETPTEDDVLALGADEVEPERRLASRDELVRIWRIVEERLSPRGIALLRALVIEELPIEQAAQEFGMSNASLYTFRSRARALMQQARMQLNATTAEALVNERSAQ
jgi:DNA-directed RNA polymerase specialized sigma24 family protein